MQRQECRVWYGKGIRSRQEGIKEGAEAVEAAGEAWDDKQGRDEWTRVNGGHTRAPRSKSPGGVASHVHR